MFYEFILAQQVRAIIGTIMNGAPEGYEFTLTIRKSEEGEAIIDIDLEGEKIIHHEVNIKRVPEGWGLEPRTPSEKNPPFELGSDEHLDYLLQQQKNEKH